MVQQSWVNRSPVDVFEEICREFDKSAALRKEALPTLQGLQDSAKPYLDAVTSAAKPYTDAAKPYLQQAMVTANPYIPKSTNDAKAMLQRIWDNPTARTGLIGAGGGALLGGIMDRFNPDEDERNLTRSTMQGAVAGGLGSIAFGQLRNVLAGRNALQGAGAPGVESAVAAPAAGGVATT